MNASDRRGFSLIELMVVTVVGFLVIMSAHNVLVTNLGAFTNVSLKIESQQTVRAGMAVLFGELREVSPASGDLLSMAPDSVVFRSMRSFGVVCAVSYSPLPPKLTVRRTGRWIKPGDSVVFLADNDEDLGTDDVWLSSRTSTVDTTAVCPSGDRAQIISLPGMSAAMTADSVRMGAPVRAYTQFTYAIHSMDGGWYLTRGEFSGFPEPLVGPLRSRAQQGFRIEYLDSYGVVTTIPTDVAQFRVRLQSASGGAAPGEALVTDLSVTRIFARN
jgi:prepilin-type N-terminal cleavage/methylation domain-containing protein